MLDGEKCKRLFERHGWEVDSDSVVSGAYYMTHGDTSREGGYDMVFIQPDGQIEVLAEKEDQ